jgi:hypothetical protein
VNIKLNITQQINLILTTEILNFKFKFHSRLAIFALLVLTPLILSAPREFVRGKDAFQKGDYIKAVVELGEFIIKKPTDKLIGEATIMQKEAYRCLGLSAYSNQNYDAAWDYLIKSDSDSARADLVKYLIKYLYKQYISNADYLSMEKPIRLLEQYSNDNDKAILMIAFYQYRYYFDSQELKSLEIAQKMKRIDPFSTNAPQDILTLLQSAKMKYFTNVKKAMLKNNFDESESIYKNLEMLPLLPGEDEYYLSNLRSTLYRTAFNYYLNITNFSAALLYAERVETISGESNYCLSSKVYIEKAKNLLKNLNSEWFYNASVETAITNFNMVSQVCISLLKPALFDLIKRANLYFANKKYYEAYQLYRVVSKNNIWQTNIESKINASLAGGYLKLELNSILSNNYSAAIGYLYKIRALNIQKSEPSYSFVQSAESSFDKIRQQITSGQVPIINIRSIKQFCDDNVSIRDFVFNPLAINGKMVDFSSYPMFIKQNLGNSCFLLAFQEKMYFGLIISTFKGQRVYTDDQCVKIIAAIKDTYTYTTTSGGSKTVPALLIYAIEPCF